MKQFIQFIFKNQEKTLFLFCDNFNIVLTFQRWFIDNQHIATYSAIGIRTPLIRKRVQRLLSAFFMPQICYGSVRGRTARFAVSFVAVVRISRMLSPSYFELTAAVNLQLRKETAHV
ncbi:hypothetical protein AKG33_00750 [Dichelobacter nodosus]|nr:hypothetical protein AKG33_00750 [Dichelobacter nodosus]